MTLDASAAAAPIFSYDSLAWAVPLSAISRMACGASIFGAPADFVPAAVVWVSLMPLILGRLLLEGLPTRRPWTLIGPLDLPAATAGGCFRWLRLRSV